jgi:hypothetical protein
MGGMGMDMHMCSSLLRLVPVPVALPVALPAASCSCMQLRRARRQQRRRQQRRHDRDKHSKRHAPPPQPRPPQVARKQSSQLAGRALARKRCAIARRSVIFFASLGNGGANGGYFYAVPALDLAQVFGGHYRWDSRTGSSTSASQRAGLISSQPPP